MASSRVTVCRRLRGARGPVSSCTRPESIESCTDATIRRSPSSATRRSRNSMTSGKLCPVSTCMSGNGKRPGRNAFSARRSSTIESLPPLNNSTGLESSAATSRMMWMASASRACRCVSSRVMRAPPVGVGSISGDVQPALGLVGPGPSPLAAVPRQGARRAADRLVAAVVQLVVGQVALVDAPEEILLGPVDQRVVLPDPAALVELDVLGVGARRPLLAADAGDPRVGAVERALERCDLGPAAAVVRARPWPGRVLDGDLDAEALLEGAPRVERLGEEHAGVDGDDAGVRRQADELVDEDGLLLLERAQHDQPWVMALDGLRQRLGEGHQASTGSGSRRSLHQSAGVRAANSRNVSPWSWVVS